MSPPALSLFAPLRAAYEASRSVRTAEDLESVLDGVAELVSGHLGWRTVVVNVHRRAWDDFRVAVVHGAPEARDALLDTTRTWDEWAPLFRDRFERRGAYVVPQGAPGAGWSRSHPHDMVLVLMRDVDGEVAGILSVDDPVSGLHPGDAELDALVAVANIAGSALVQAREAAREAEHRAALERLLAVSSQIADARSGSGVLEAVCAGIRDGLGFERVTVQLAGADGALRSAAHVGWDRPPDIDVALADISRLFVADHEEHGCYLLERCDALSTLGLSDSPYHSRLNGRGPWAWSRHWLLVPLRDQDGGLVGFIWPDEPTDRLRPDTGRLQALRLFADQAQAALERARNYEHAVHLARHDGLTGLPNRAQLLDRLQQVLAGARRADRTIAVLFVDLDRFKAVNDTYGHEVGDEALRVVASRIDEHLRPGDLVARLGGDEFVVLCQDIADALDALEVARRLRAALARPIRVGSVSVTLTASVGVALPNGPHDDAGELLRDADVAMYRAKEHGRDAEELASPALRAGASARAQLEGALGGALARDEIRLFWQPIVSVADGRVVRMEALSRWVHPGLGWVSPLEFIPIAEETGFIVELGRWVLERACAQWTLWRARRGVAAPSIAVNLSPRQLRDPGLLGFVDGLVARHDMPPGALCVEITEGALLESGPSTEHALAGLRALGVELDLDDFGTGFSSLASLERYHVDGLKIDRRFVAGRERDPRAGAIVEALLVMARALGLRATAEGVETAEQLRWLAGLGAEQAQGFHFARPAPAEKVDALIASAEPRAAA